MRSALHAAVLTLAAGLAGCGDGGESADGTKWCTSTCERFKLCIPSLEDSPGQIWVCRCEENTALWDRAGECIEACARASSCDDLWSYFRNYLTGAVQLYFTDFYACDKACK